MGQRGCPPKVHWRGLALVQPHFAVDLSGLSGLAGGGSGIATLQRRRGEVAAPFGQDGETTVVLENHQWNHVVWEIDNVTRDHVTSFEICGLMCSHEPEAVDVLTYDLDHLELQQVEPDFIEGRTPGPGRWLTVMPGTNPAPARALSPAV